MTTTNQDKRRAAKKHARKKKNQRLTGLGKGGSATRRQWKDEELRY